MQEQQRERAAMAAMTAVLFGLLLLFLLAFFNRFIGLRSGDGEFLCGISWLRGLLPYRDYFSTAPPLNTMKSALLLKMFGQALIVSRAAGVVERLLIALLLFRWLALLFAPWRALLATVVTLIVSSGDHADPIASYNHDAILFAMLCGYAATLLLRAEKTPRVFGLALLSGACGSLSLLTKQTIGLGILLAIGLATTVLLARMPGSRWRRLGWFWGGYATGAILPAGIAAVWLARLHLLEACVRMLFVAGPAAKASHPGEFLAREISVARSNPVWLSLALLAVVLCWRAIARGVASGTADNRPTVRQALWCLAGGVLVIGVAEALAYTSLPALEDFSKASVYYVVCGLTLWLLTRLPMLTRGEVDTRHAQMILLASTGWATMFALSLSWPAFEAMTLPGLGFLLAAALEGVRERARWFLLLVMAAMVFIQVRERLDLPFDFGRQREAPIRFANQASEQPMLRGMRLPAATVRLLDDTVAAVANHTSPRDTFLSYPDMSVLYALTGRYPPTVALSHNIDTTNDAFSRSEAQRLLAAPPAVILYARPSADYLHDEEVVWRHGQPSGQRDLIAAVDRIVAHYRLVGTYVLRPGDAPVQLYVRP